MIETINKKKFLTISASELMAEFKKYIGQPYVYGGDGTLKACMSSNCTHHNKNKKYVGYDCSGYMYKVLSKWNYNKFGRSTSQMMDNSTYGEWIYDRDDLKVGDLMFFTGHVGVVSSNQNHIIKMYHAPKCGKNLCEVDSNYRKDFIKGLRILKCNLDDKSKKDGDRMKICINYGHAASGIGTGAVGILNESKETRNVGKEVVRLLKEHSDHNIIVADYNGSDNYVKSTNYANQQKADLFISIHFNAGVNDKNGNGKSSGTEVLVYNTSSSNPEAKRIQTNICKLGFRDRGVKQDRTLHVLKNTKMRACLVECCFVDDKDDVKLYNYKTMAKAIAEGILNKTLSEKPVVSEFKNGDYTGRKAKVNATSLNVRYDRGVNHEVIAKLSNGQIVDLGYCLDGWIGIHGFKGNKGFGYVSTDYLELI